MDVEREFQRGTSVTVEDDLLETTGRSTGLRLGVGGSLGMGDGVVLRGGGGTNGFGGRLELKVRFRSLRRRKYCRGKTYPHTVRDRIFRHDFSFQGISTCGN